MNDKRDLSRGPYEFNMKRVLFLNWGKGAELLAKSHPPVSTLSRCEQHLGSWILVQEHSPVICRGGC